MSKNRWLAIGLIVLSLTALAVLWCVLKTPNIVTVHVFYAEGDSRSQKTIKYLDKTYEDNNKVEIVYYEVWDNESNAEKLNNLIKDLDIQSPALPFVIVGKNGITGYISDTTTGVKIDRLIQNCKETVKLEDLTSIEVENEPVFTPIIKPDGEDAGDKIC